MAKIIDFKAIKEAFDAVASPPPTARLYARTLDDAWMLLVRVSDELREAAYELAMSAGVGLPANERRTPETSRTDDIAECGDDNALGLAEMSDELMILANHLRAEHKKLTGKD